MLTHSLAPALPPTSAALRPGARSTTPAALILWRRRTCEGLALYAVPDPGNAPSLIKDSSAEDKSVSELQLGTANMSREYFSLCPSECTSRLLRNQNGSDHVKAMTADLSGSRDAVETSTS